MANVLVVIELVEGRALPVALEALGQARRISTRLGATLYAVVPIAHAPRYGEGDLIEVLARHGADKVVLVTDEKIGSAGPMRWGSHGGAVAQVCELLPPFLLLYGGTEEARQVAPRSAARLGAAFLADAWIEIDDAGKLLLWEGSGPRSAALEGELDFSVVATVPPGRYRTARGDEEAEVEVIEGPRRAADFDELGWEADLLPAAIVLLPEPPETFDQGWEAAPVPTGIEAAAAVLASALSGEVRRPQEPIHARLVVSLGASLEGAQCERRVILGETAAHASAHYALDGDAATLARALAAAVTEERAGATLPIGALRSEASK